MIYFHMARFLWEGKRDSLQLRREAVRMDLTNWKEKSDMGFLDLKRARLRVITAGEASCPECRALEGRLFTFDEADSAMLVPSSEPSDRSIYVDKGPGFSHNIGNYQERRRGSWPDEAPGNLVTPPRCQSQPG